MSEDLIRYERDGIVITVEYDQITFRKNGLKIEVPVEVLEDFIQLLEVESAKLDRENKEMFAKLFKGKS